MAFDIAYIFTAKDKYTRIAKKVAASNDKIKISAANASRAIKAKLGAALSVISVKALNAKASISAMANSLNTNLRPAMISVRNAGLTMSAAITLPIVLAAKSLKDAARDAVESRSKFATVFQDVSKESQQSADILAANFGLTGTKARELLGDTGDLLSGFGFTGDAALQMATQVNELAVDLASFTNFSGGAEGASAALTKALLGERESLKTLGIAILEKDVKAKVSQLLAEGQTFSSLRQAKAHATLALAIEQSKNAIGDFARTSGDLANQERITSSRIQDLKESFGNVLMPIALKLTQAIRSMAVRLTELSPSTKKIILIVAGLAAVMGPLLLVVASIGLALPILAGGFAAIGTALIFLTGPVGIMIALTVALGVFLAKSKAVGAFFSGVGLGLKESIGPALAIVVTDMKAAAKVIAQLFGSDSAANDAINSSSENLMAFANAGRFVGNVVGGVLDGIITALRIVGDLIGQVVAAIATLDFTQFDFGSITDKFKGFAERVGLIDAPAAVIEVAAKVSDQTAVIKLLPEVIAAIPDQTAILKLVPDATALNTLATASPATATASPAVATANARATVNGQITVSATEGSQIDSVESQQAFKGTQGNVGIGAAA